MRGLTDFLITVHVMRGLVGRGPALFGCLFVLAIPGLFLAELIDQLYPGGFWTFGWNLVTTVIKGFRL